MADFKGGRGKKAGYETQMYRIPVPLKPTVERLGLQFRLLWDGLIDPRGEKLISRIEAVIPDPEQLDDDQKNLISGISSLDLPDIKFKELEDKLALADTAISELRSQLEEQKRTEQALRRGQKHLEQELEEANQEIERLQLQHTESQNRPALDPEAIALLQDAITPKSKGGSYAANNATGLKKLVEQALALLTHD